MKSVLKVGKYATSTVEKVLAADCATNIRELYYTRQEIDFTDDVKEAARIFISIDKPGTSVDAWEENKRLVSREKFGKMTDLERMKYWSSKRRMKKAKRASIITSRIQSQIATKGQMQSINHGHSYWNDKR